MSYKLKQITKDFIVKEIFDIDRFISEDNKYTYFIVKKTNTNTIDTALKIAKFLHLSERDIGYSGTKDKRAITSQFFSAKGNVKEKLTHFKNENITLEILNTGNQPISLGDHICNEFEIAIRNLDNTNFIENIRDKSELQFINLFGEQRFGKNNTEIGLSLIKGNFKRGYELIINSHQSYNTSEHLKKYPNDYLGAIKKYPRKLLSLFVNSYQSKIWNSCVEKFSDEFIPIPGFGIEFENQEIDNFYQDKLKQDNINYRDFIIRELPEIRAEGILRKRIETATNFKILKIEDDDLNEQKKKIIIKFRLPKGSYATEFIRQLVLGTLP